MLRVLIFFLWVILFALTLTLLFSIRSTVSASMFGWRFDIPAGVALTIAIGLAAIIAGATALIKDFVAAPKMARAKREIERREKGLAAITKGLEAIAIGDASAARRQAAIATKTLGGPPVAKLIAAQAAHLSGDDAAAGEALAGMLAAPETEFLALRGLYAKAARNGDRAAALQHATRAFDLHDKARWAFDAVFDLALERRDYFGAGAALARAAKAKTLDQGAADRGVAATLTAAAFVSYAAGDQGAAMSDVDAALKRAPGFAPAATLASRLHMGAGDRRRAMKILGNAFAEAPDRAIVDTLLALTADEPAEIRAAELDRLAARNPDHGEALLARARAAMLRGDAALAAATIGETLRSSAPARALSMMAAAQGALHGDGAARVWLERAAAAPRDASPGADEFFRITGEGWRRIIHDYLDHGRLAPPPLEGPPPGLSDETLTLALAPPPAPPVVVEEAPEPPETPEAQDAAEETPDTDERLDRAAAAARGVN